MSKMKNKEEVKEALNWGEKEVNMMVAMTRAKENSELSANNRFIHRSIIREKEEFEDTIQHLNRISNTEDYSFRLYVSVNSRNVVKGAKLLQDHLNESFYHLFQGNETIIKNFKKMDSNFKSILQKEECRESRNFMFDLDNTTQEDVSEVTKRISGEVILTRESPNGHHIITEPFHYTEDFEDIDVDMKTDGLIYIGRL